MFNIVKSHTVIVVIVRNKDTNVQLGDKVAILRNYLQLKDMEYGIM